MQNLGSQDDPGWFYHSSASKSKEPAPRPLMSQIPLLNGCPDDKVAGPNRLCRKNTDTECVKSANEDGVSDLLNYKEFKKSEEAVGYARNSWFYLEDNANLDARNKKDEKKDVDSSHKNDINWTFGVPSYKSNIQNIRKSKDQQISNASINCKKPMMASRQVSWGQLSSNKKMASDGRVSPNKTKLTNGQEPSNQPMVSGGQVSGITDQRSRKTSQICSPDYIVERVVGVAPEPEFRNPILQQEYFRSLPVVYAKTEEDSAVSMSKLLSYSYGRERNKQDGSGRVPPHTAQGPENNRNQTTDKNNGRSMDGFENSKPDSAAPGRLNSNPDNNPET